MSGSAHSDAAAAPAALATGPREWLLPLLLRRPGRRVRRLTVFTVGGTIGGIAGVPSSGGSRRVLLAAAALGGAAAVGLAWLLVGSGGNAAVNESLASLGQAPGIAPPAYAYLDNPSVALYLGQLEGGIAKSEQLTQQLTQGKSAGLSAGGFSVGGQTGSSASAERVVTPTATARFYQLLDLLGRDGYLHTIDMAATPAQIRRSFAAVPEGSFVELHGCQLALPSYVQLGQLQSGVGGYLTAGNAYGLAGQTSPVDFYTLEQAQQLASGGRHARAVGYGTGTPLPERKAKRLARAIGGLAAVDARNPRVPLSTCDGKVDFRPHGVDLLFPIRLGNLSGEQSLLAGPVTVVGKLVRSVRTERADYVDNTSLTTFTGPVSRVDEAASGEVMTNELDADTSVLAPGAVILPVAIYK
jgi:hypothetical protein